MKNTVREGESMAQEERSENATVSQPGFICAPTEDQLKPSENEEYMLEVLQKWQENSAKSQIILGQPCS